MPPIANCASERFNVIGLGTFWRRTARKLACALAVICIAMVDITVAAPKKAPSDIEYFISDGDYLDLKISPDGEHLAALVRSDGNVALLFLSLSDGQVTGGTRTADGDRIIGYRWVNNERVIFEVAEKVRDLVNASATGELFAVNLDGSDSERIFGFRAGSRSSGRMKGREPTLASQQILSRLPDDPRRILIVEYPWEIVGNTYRDTRDTFPVVSKLDVYNGTKTEVATLPQRGAGVLATNEGDLRFMQWVAEDSTTRSAFRFEGDENWRPLDADLGDAKNPFLLSLSEDGNAAFLMVEMGKAGIDAIVRYDLTDNSIATLTDTLPSDIENILFDPETSEPIVVTTLPGLPDHHYLDRKHWMTALHRGLLQSFPGQMVDIISTDDSGTKLVIRVSSDRNPGEYYLFNRKTKEARFIFANRSWMDPKSLPTTLAGTFEASDGLEIPALLTQPTTESDAPLPLVVVTHGGPHGVRSRWTFDEEIQLLASRGYAVLQVNFRGSGGYGEQFERQGYGEWGDAIISDIVAGIDWASDTSKRPLGNICVYGASFGAYASMMLGARIPDRIDCVAAYAGVYDLPLLYNSGDITQLRWGESYLDKALGTDADVQRAQSPSNLADRIQAPVWLVHGDEDQRAPIEHAENMLEALKAADATVEYTVLEGGGHGIFDEQQRIEFYDALLKFLESHLND